MGRLEQSAKEQREAVRELARIIARAQRDPVDDPTHVVDTLMAAGFPEDTDADTVLLDNIDPHGASGLLSERGGAKR